MTNDGLPISGRDDDSKRPPTRTWPIYRRLLGYAWRYKARLIVSLLFAVLVASSLSAVIVSAGTVFNILFQKDPAKVAEKITDGVEDVRDWLEWLPGVSSEWVDHLTPRLLHTAEVMRANQLETVAWLCLFILAVMFVSGVARYIQEYFAGSIGAHISVTLADEMYRNMMRQPLSFFERHPSGEFTTRLTNDIRMVNVGLSGVVMKLMREPFKAVGLLIVALTADRVLTLVGLLVLPPIGVVIVLVGKSVRRNAERSMRKLSSMQTLAKESLTGMPIVKGFGMEPYLIGRMKEELRKLDRYLVKLVKADAALGPVSEFLMTVGVVGFFLVGAYRLYHDYMGVGDFSKLLFAFIALLDPIRKLTNVNNQIQMSVASAQRIFEYIDQEPELREAPDAVELPPLSQSLRFNDVHFSYDGKAEIIRGLDLEVRKGEMVALVGFSGAGKSTLVKLVPRFYDVTSGSITIDGVDVRNATFVSLREQIGIVTQDSVLFSETIRANIAFGRTDFPEDRVRAAAQAAHAAEFIDSLPAGYDTWVAEGGVSLSGGQRQRLAIARAVVKDPAILILDEATSNLDSESERAIQQAIDEFVVGRTTLVIAHRLSTIQRADRIVVMDNGRIAEQGTHHELLEKGGIYRRLYEIQFAPTPERAPR